MPLVAARPGIRKNTAPAGPGVCALWRFDFSASPSTSNGWTYANGSFFGGVERNGSGAGNGWQSDCHAGKTLGNAYPVLAAGIALRNSGSSPGYSWTTDTDPDDFGIMSFCSEGGATCHIYLGFGSNFIQARLGRNGTLLATASTVMPTSTVGQWVYIESEVKVDDTTGYVKVWQDGVLVINFAGDTRNAGASALLDTVKMGGYWPTNLFTDDFYIAQSRAGDPGNVNTMTPCSLLTVTDSFNRANGALGVTDTGSKTWLYADDAGGTSPWAIDTNKAKPPLTPFSAMAYFDLGTHYGYDEADLGNGTPGPGLVMCSSGAVRTGWFPIGIWVFAGSGGLNFGYDNGASFAYFISSVSSPANAIIRLIVDGTGARFTINGAAGPGPYAVPAAFTTFTKCGIMKSASGQPTMDAFVAQQG